jgi:formylglycine-generating enzyme
MGHQARKAAMWLVAWCVAGSVWPAAAERAGGTSTVRIPAARFESLLPPARDSRIVEVAEFELDRTPVTNAQFARFVAAQPRWRRDRIPRVFADESYLSHWQDASTPADGTGEQPVTRVSWFAANAYCEARGQRLPTWHEWELASAAGETTRDARQDPAWRQAILDWYARPASAALPEVGRTP